MPSANRIRVSAAVIGVVVMVGALVGCGSKKAPPSVDYAVDATVTTYNANTVSGATGGALMALARVLPGFSFTGPGGEVVADRDVGVATQRGESRTQTIDYAINPQAQYSDGTPLTCDSMVLAWAALSGKFPGFEPASTVGYRDIKEVQCQPGAKRATVVFAKPYLNWQGLFGAGTLLPPKVITSALKIPNVVTAVEKKERGTVEKIARMWNTWALEPDKVTTESVPALGPYKIESFNRAGGLVLVANDKWWGQPARANRITVWPRNSDVQVKLHDKAIDVVDVGYRSSTDPELPVPGGDETDTRSTGVEQLVLASKGSLAQVRSRAAFAACVPREKLAKDGGKNAEVTNLRIVPSTNMFAEQINSEVGTEYRSPNTKRAAAAGKFTVRIGYVGPDNGRKAAVKSIADSCAASGITVTDASSPQIGPQALGSQVDALLTSSDLASASSGGAASAADTDVLRKGNRLNVIGYDEGAVENALEALDTVSDPERLLPLLRGAERRLWTDIPTIPLYQQQRTIGVGAGIAGVVPGLGAAGTGWNMDRWTLPSE